MSMICRKCNKEIPDGSVFCSNCGYDLREPTSTNHSNKSEEQIPLVFLINQIVKHKIVSILSVVAIALAIGGYVAFKEHQVKKQAEAALMQELDHIMEIVGTYKNDDITLVLSADNTAQITYKKSGWNEITSKGYWKEKFDGGLIEIEFSKSLEDIYIGNEKRYYCSALYLVGTRLWESMSAIKSQDYGASEYLTKE